VGHAGAAPRANCVAESVDTYIPQDYRDERNHMTTTVLSVEQGDKSAALVTPTLLEGLFNDSLYKFVHVSVHRVRYYRLKPQPPGVSDLRKRISQLRILPLCQSNERNCVHANAFQALE
jgi:hypothetical protein